MLCVCVCWDIPGDSVRLLVSSLFSSFFRSLISFFFFFFGVGLLISRSSATRYSHGIHMLRYRFVSVKNWSILGNQGSFVLIY